MTWGKIGIFRTGGGSELSANKGKATAVMLKY